jgi:hypothetical protein
LVISIIIIIIFYNKGKIIFDEGSIYEGEWLKGLMHGKGKKIYSKGDVYEGAFKEGQMHGDGSFTFASDGYLLKGLWKNDRYFGME